MTRPFPESLEANELWRIERRGRKWWGFRPGFIEHQLFFVSKVRH